MERKRLFLLLSILVMCLSMPVISKAAESQDYQSNGQISFFGKYVNPDPGEPSEPGSSSETGGSHSGGNSASGGKDPGHALEKIPQTGDTSHLSIRILGLLFTVSAFLLVRKYKNMQWR
ncbi:LPXTG cell wall anchor domain-containing protein [Bacillus pseudomycoides]|uniref:LPXTG cell wall anchor domain-containing protein n=1 Tax=Bacillus bingmayongensis TaxID=1150157 RepID=A0ABU5JSI3_9BACI|nr:LPXTG cell wall anchor domain-containing protein [Bacillus pseudomycoides]